MARSTLTLRVPPEIADRLRSVADQNGESVNAYATRVLGAAVDPELAGSEIERVRERLARAGLLAQTIPVAHARPDPELVARARRAAGKGTPLSELVSQNRE